MRRKGFTLMELILVIAIIAILAGAMIPLFNVTREQARRAKATAEVDVIVSAAQMLRADTDAWPPTGDLGAGLINSGGIANWVGPYIAEWKTDPWGTQRYRVTNPSGTRLIAESYASGGADGGTGNEEDVEQIIRP